MHAPEPTLRTLDVKIDRVIDTLTTFAGTVNEKFRAIDDRFDAMDERFNAMDRSLLSMNERMDGIDSRLGNVEQRLGKIEVIVLDTQEELQSALTAIDKDSETLLGHAERIAKLERASID